MIEHDDLLFETEGQVKAYNNFKTIYDRGWNISIRPAKDLGCWEVIIMDGERLVKKSNIGFSSLICNLDHMLSETVFTAIVFDKLPSVNSK